MENNYWIVDDLIIFKPEFNEELINYYDIINKYQKIIFSNYDKLEIMIETNNEWINKYDNKYNNNLTHLTFGEYFNQKIDLSNNINLTHLIFG